MLVPTDVLRAMHGFVSSWTVGVDFLSLAEWQVEKKPSKDSKEACLAWLARDLLRLVSEVL